jgi:flagellar basal-body rod protein FlgB
MRVGFSGQRSFYMSTLGIFDKTGQLLQKVMDLRQQNQDVIASNIANAQTPGYAPARLQFEDALAGAVGRDGQGMATTHPQHLPVGGGLNQVQGKVMRTPDRSGLGDGNNVNLDQEMIGLAENQILFEAAAQMLNKKMGLLKYAAQDGR